MERERGMGGGQGPLKREHSVWMGTGGALEWLQLYPTRSGQYRCLNTSYLMGGEEPSLKRQ